MSTLKQIAPTTSIPLGSAPEVELEDIDEKTDDPNIKRRRTWVKLENSWKYINICMIRDWKVKRVPNLIDLTVSINDVMIKPSSKTDQYFVFHFPTLRAKWFELLGQTPAECDMIALEDACMYNQLVSIGQYSKVPKASMKGSLFTSELTIFFAPVWKTRSRQLASKLEVIEEYFISDVHRERYSD